MCTIAFYCYTFSHSTDVESLATIMGMSAKYKQTKTHNEVELIPDWKGWE